MRLKKKLGQHLLIAPGVLKKLTELMQVKPGEVVVEIGPGTGNLTKELLKTPLKKLYLIEIDPEMIKKLREHLEDERVEIIQADASEFDFSLLKEKELKVVGNLPYNVASLIIENTVLFKDFIPSAFYMVQKEVAERLIEENSWLSVFLRTFYKVHYLMSIPARFFFPPPKVQSAFIRLERIEALSNINLKKYKNFLTRIFSQKRKMLKHKIEPEFLEKAGVLPTKRVEELELKDFLALYFSSQESM